LGIGMIVYHTGSLDYVEVFAALPDLVGKTVQILPGEAWAVLTLTAILLFVGAMGKSAQFPLHVWLPDSMEGPTPISALIHAATMVTAGIFMVARMSPIFELSDVALSVVMVIGGITSLSMGLLGIIQYDIKRVVAYSTLSQLGLMTIALGASAYHAAIFHLMTHAFFKALLFLAAGSVIIAIVSLMENKYFLDAFNEKVLAAGARLIGKGLWKAGDQGIIDGVAVNGSARTIGWLASLVRHLQTGFIYDYAIAMIVGVAILLYWFVPIANR
ncbi:MAG: hypothetical protein EBU79_06975, partial [Betaproteobacteria bacterium]|nr:hypothetical protein [Betaproteobacteria bacterium]